MSKIPFQKMHGCGNDYVYVRKAVKNPKSFAKQIASRHTSIGSDGLVLVLRSKDFDAEMRMYNSDGSEGSMCGNAIRCVARILFDRSSGVKNVFRIKTKSGTKFVKFDKVTELATVDMGGYKILGTGFITHVDVGNPHAIVYVADVCDINIQDIGFFVGSAKYFKDGVNVEFVQVISKNHLKMRVYERGSGVTMACGTGAVASCVASVKNGFCKMNERIKVTCDGGDLFVVVYPDGATLEGPCEYSFKGVIEIED